MSKKTRNSAYTKLYNRKLILGTLLRTPMSRADLAREIGLTRAAISIIVDSMISDGIVLEKGPVVGGLGRNPIILDINPDCYYALGLNISRASCSLGIINIKGQVINSKEINIENASTALEAIEIIEDEIRIISSETDFKKNKLLGLGITTPGPLDTQAGTIINPPNFKIWENVSIVSEFKKAFSFEVKLENISSALALAEKNYGQGRNFSDFILLVVDTGIGAGIITNNNPYKGANSLGAEIGHTSINYMGKPCSCGNKGCLEVYASIPSILENAKKYDPSITTWDDVVDRAEEGDPNFLSVIDEEAQYLAASIVNAVNILGIEAVILAGHVTYKPSLLLQKLNEKVNALAINRYSYQTHILISEIEQHAGIIAAGSVIFRSLV